MKFLADENFPLISACLLRKEGHKLCCGLRVERWWVVNLKVMRRTTLNAQLSTECW